MKRYVKASRIISSLTPEEKQLIREIFDECGINYTESTDQSTEGDVVYNEFVILAEPRTLSSSANYQLLQNKLAELESNHNIRDNGFGREHIFYKCVDQPYDEY